ncbi:MAG: DUF1330 domain-containing protein [Rhodospirillaceae bacterium]|nr:DUF1330 domain-containing protein [Rhodospirillaceae bacterium]
MRSTLLALAALWVGCASLAAEAADAACDKPAHMLILGGTEDFAALSEEAKANMRKYAAEVPALVAQHGGVFKVRGRAGAVIEGTFPAWKNIVVSDWPCAQAAQNFWHSEKYEQEVHPLRKGNAAYDIALYPDAPKDPRATGVWTAGGGASAKGIQCDAPVYFLVAVTVKAPEKLAAYRKAMLDSGIQYSYGAVDVLLGAPLDVLEGQWPKDFNAKVTRWPCREAFDAFYTSADYQTKYKPLRKEAGDFTAVIAPAYAPK